MNLQLILLILVSQLGGLVTSNAGRQIEYEERWFETRVDHYGFMNNDKYMMRYLYSDKYYKPGGPIFFYPGNEGAAELFAENTGFMWEYAPQFNALLIFGEFRFYGKSLPYKNVSEDRRLLNYLTTEQAMSDYIDLLSTEFPNFKVITIGGSYGGMIAAWMRMRYPEYITGALASSALIYQFEGLTDCSARYETVTKLFNHYFKESPKNIKRMWTVLGGKSEDSAYLEYLWRRIGLCDSPNMNIDDLFSYIERMFVTSSMGNYPTPANLYVPLPAYPVYLMASFFSEPNMEAKDFEVALALLMNFYFNNTGNQDCFSLQHTDGNVNDFFWHYQLCTEVTLYLCSKENERNMYRPRIYNKTALTESCQRQFGVSPDTSWLPREFNAGDMTSYSNIIFSNGEYDPCLPGGVLEDINDSVVSIFIENAAHHLDLRSSSPNDPPSVTAARKREVEILREWLKTD